MRPPNHPTKNPEKPNGTRAKRGEQRIRVDAQEFSLKALGQLTRDKRLGADPPNNQLRVLAETFDLSESNLSRIERGEVLPSGALIPKMIRYAFGHDVVIDLDPDGASPPANSSNASDRIRLALIELGLEPNDRELVLGLIKRFARNPNTTPEKGDPPPAKTAKR